jgi:Ca-activated chloride channel family protein
MPLTLECWVDRTNVTPSGTAKCCVAFEIGAVGEPLEGERPAARTILALDVSASMKGEPIDQVIRSVDRLLDALDGGARAKGAADEIGIVAFAQGATRVVDPVRVDAAGKRLVRSRVGRLYVEAATNIEAGLDLSAKMLEDTPAGMRRAVVLLSDGAPNVGAHTAEALREVVRRHRPNVSFFCLGYGADHSEQILSTIGEAGGGGYEFIPDPASCARSFARALGAQGDAVASGVELTLGLAEGVELVRFVVREETRFSRDGITVSLPDMVGGARRLVVAELLVHAPGPDRFVVDLVQAKLRSRAPAVSREAPSVHTKEADAAIEVAERAPAVVPDAARRVLLARADEVRESARQLADRGQFAGAGTTIRRFMAEIDQLPGWVVNDGTALAEAYELLVDEAMAFERRPDAEAYAAFKKATVNSKLAASVPSAARSRGDASQKLIEHVAGNCPKAWLVEVGGARHVLAEECVIGRTAEADLRVPSQNVSRRHAQVFADAGAYWVSDMGSTNTTEVNGSKLGTAPHRLAPGDIVRVGDVELRYEEE